MTKNARSVLADCKLSFGRLANNQDAGFWRIDFVATITLLRSVGHVLHATDSKGSRYVARAIAEQHERAKGIPIFCDFIRAQRNIILKEYGWNFDRHTHHKVNPRYEHYDVGPFDLGAGDKLFVSEHTFLIREGAFAGQNLISVLKEAMDFWDRELDWIDSRARELQIRASTGLRSETTRSSMARLVRLAIAQSKALGAGPRGQLRLARDLLQSNGRPISIRDTAKLFSGTPEPYRSFF